MKFTLFILIILFSCTHKHSKEIERIQLNESISIDLNNLYNVNEHVELDNNIVVSDSIIYTAINETDLIEYNIKSNTHRIITEKIPIKMITHFRVFDDTLSIYDGKALKRYSKNIKNDETFKIDELNTFIPITKVAKKGFYNSWYYADTANFPYLFQLKSFDNDVIFELGNNFLRKHDLSEVNSSPLLFSQFNNHYILVLVALDVIVVFDNRFNLLKINHLKEMEWFATMTKESKQIPQKMYDLYVSKNQLYLDVLGNYHILKLSKSGEISFSGVRYTPVTNPKDGILMSMRMDENDDSYAVGITRKSLLKLYTIKNREDF